MSVSQSLPNWPVLRRDSIPLRIRKKIAWLYPTLPQGEGFDAQLFGQVYQGRLGIHMDDKVFLYGSHEPATIRLMRGLLRHRRAQKNGEVVYLDIGTNTGQHLITVSACADRAFGFEPYQPVREKALQNVKRNKLSHVKIFDFGLSDMDAELPFTAPDGKNLGVGTFLDTAETAQSPKLILKVRQGDALLDEQGIIPDVIKIDTEGFEKNVLTGLSQTIARYHPDIVFEYGRDSRQDLGSLDARRALFGDGYHYFGIARSREFPKLVPFSPEGKFENVLATRMEIIPELDLS